MTKHRHTKGLMDTRGQRWCKTCETFQDPRTAFSKNRSRTDGLSAMCKTCDNARQTIWRSKNKDRIKAKDRRLYLANRAHKIAYAVQWSKRRYQTDPHFRMIDCIRGRIRKALKGKTQKSATTEKLLGCKFAFAREHIEKQFTEGMTWENHGLGEGFWHIDHIKSIASFKHLDTPHEQRQCFHYTNLQPLWSGDNLRKHAHYDPTTDLRVWTDDKGWIDLPPFAELYALHHAAHRHQMAMATRTSDV